MDDVDEVIVTQESHFAKELHRCMKGYSVHNILVAAAGSNELHLRLVHSEGCCDRLELSNCDGRVFGSRVNICSRVSNLSSNRMRSTERDPLLESAHGVIEIMVGVK